MYMYGDAVAGSTVKMAGRRRQRHTGITDGGDDEDSDDYICGGSGSIDPIPTEVCDGVGVGRRRRELATASPSASGGAATMKWPSPLPRAVLCRRR